MQNKFVQILIILIVITAIFMLWQFFSEPYADTERMIRERAVPEENYEFLNSEAFNDLGLFERIWPIEIDKSGRSNPFIIY